MTRSPFPGKLECVSSRTHSSPTTYRRSEAIIFRRTREDWGVFSNMAGGLPLCVPLRDGRTCTARTAEALYQACRFPEYPNIQAEILEQASPMRAKWISRHYQEFTRPDWDCIRLQVMRWCLRLKLVQHPETFGELLLRTGNLPIVEESHRDDFWGARPNGDVLIGMNMLGRLLTELRDGLRKSLQTQRCHNLQIPPPGINRFLLLGSEVCAFLPGEAWSTWCNQMMAKLADTNSHDATSEVTFPIPRQRVACQLALPIFEISEPSNGE